MEVVEYKVEQINISDDKYLLTDISISNGSFAHKGDILCTYESSKSDYEVILLSDGYVYFDDKLKVDDELSVGRLIAIVVDSPLENQEVNDYFKSKIATSNAPKSSLDVKKIVTKKAQLLIAKYGIDLGQISESIEVVDENIIEKIIAEKKGVISSNNNYNTRFPERDLAKFKFPKKLALIGAGKSAMQILDILSNQSEYIVSCLYDDNVNLHGHYLIGMPIIGPVDFNQIKKDYELGVFNEIIVCFSGATELRKKYFELIVESNIPLANLIHKKASVSSYASLGRGNIIFANVVISAFAEVGDNNFISAFTNIEHHNRIGSHNTFGPGVMFSGSCIIGDLVKFGTGIYIEPRINIGSNSIISSGSIIRTNVPPNSVVRVKYTEEIKTRTS